MKMNKIMIPLLMVMLISGALSVNVEKRSNSLQSNNQNNNIFVPNNCPVGIKTSCTYNIVPGCAKFKNGTYAYLTGGNRCTYCSTTGSNVVAFNENQKCPVVATQPSQNNTYVPSVCPSNPAQFCTFNLVPGCAKFKNGTYAYLSNGNKCTQCQKSDIVAFNEGQQCPVTSTQPSNPGYQPSTCPANPAQFCTFNIAPGCAKFSNGTYAYLTNGNKCTQCQNKNIVAFNEGQQCPVTSTQPSNPGYQPSTCPANPAQFCTFNIAPGCAKFSNGTYAYLTNGNKCTQCQNKNIVAFNEGQQCPFVPNKCPDYTNIRVNCLRNIVPGCAGYKNGTYAYLTSGNRCSYCSPTGSNVISFNEGEKCPTN